MNKKELIEQVAEKAELKKIDAERALSAFEEVVIENIKKGEKIALVGFGTFTVTERKKRTGRNPKTGESIVIPAKRTPKFIVGKVFKDALADK